MLTRPPRIGEAQRSQPPSPHAPDAVIQAFLNHANATERSTERVVEGGVMFVRARRALPAGAELTSAYFEDDGDPATKPTKWDF